MLYDPYSRHISYLRISVTDRCNLRCAYCMPEEGVKLLEHEQVLSLEEIAKIAKKAVDMGIRKIRLTGGEPLIRKGITNLVGMLASLEGLEDLAMTTNGVLLSRFAWELKAKGLHRVNISLDTLDPDRYRELTRGGEVEAVLEGIFAAQKAGLLPIKLNTVIPPEGDRGEAEKVAAFGEKHGFQVRFIHQMDLKNGVFTVVEGGEGGNCSNCSRLRLSSEGVIYPCLFSDRGYSTKELGIAEAILGALENKPEKGEVSHSNSFYHLGG